MPAERRPAFGLSVQAVIGILAIVYGLVLTADNLFLFHAARVLRYWPIGIVAVGIVMYGRAADAAAKLSAGFVIGIGAWLTAGRWFGWSVSLAMIWPLLLISAGVALVVRSRDAGVVAAATFDAEHRFSDFAFWSGVKRRITSPLWRRADFTAVMGGIELDLSAATLTSGEAIVDVFIMMGGMQIKVPPDWAVANQIVAVMAGVDDRSTGTQDAKNRLILRGFVMMGGVEIKT